MLADREIHLWSSSIRKPEAVLRNLYRLLSPGEREKAAQFRFDKHRNGYIAAHGLLRSILAHYVPIEPEKLEFTNGPKGKPALCSASVYFNMSHSNDAALYAVAREPKLGVDVEWIRPLPDMLLIARQFFSTGEYRDLLTSEKSERNKAFFNCWTRKEAFVKAVGDGLSAPLNRFQVTLKPGEPAAFVTIPEDQNVASEWSLFHWEGSDQYAGAVAVYGKGWHVTEKSIPALS